MPDKSWTIGSDSTCDLVVKNNRVSGRHCRLTVESARLMLTDLGSTNGTYVNEERLSGTRVITTADVITLGQSQPMPWPNEVNPNAAELSRSQESTVKNEAPVAVITIGRGPHNTVVLSDSNVSTNHARLLVDGQKIVVEDLGSTNGTSIGRVENKITRGIVQHDDQIFLGSISYRVADLIDQSPPASAAVKIDPGKPQSTPKTNNRHLVAGTLGLAAVVLVGLVWFVTTRPAVETTGTATSPTEATNTSPSAESKETLTEEKRAEVSPRIAMSDETVDSVDSVVPPEEVLPRALFLIVCADAQRSTPFRVGTVFAIDSNTLVTSASVIRAMEDLKDNGFPKAFLFSPKMGTELEIVSATIHPQFELADAEARKAQQTHDAIFDQLESKPPTPEAFDAVKDRLVAARQTALQAMDRKAAHDVAVIKTPQPLAHWLPPATEKSKLRPNQKVKVSGYAFDIEDPFFDRNVPPNVLTMSGRARQVVTTPSSNNGRLIAGGTGQQMEYAFLGSPVLNTQGQVVGVYSRPTPLAPGTESQSDPMFDAALIERAHECR